MELIRLPEPTFIVPGLVAGPGFHQSVDTATAYRYFRLFIFDNNGNANDMRIGEFKISDDGGTTKYPSSNMTSNSAPSPLVSSASSEDQGSKAAWHAFDGTGDLTNAWQPTSPNFVNSWLKIDLGSGNEIVPNFYEIWSDSTLAPKEWVFQGSNDGSTWDTLDERSGETGWSSETRSWTKVSDWNTPAAGEYRFLRFYWTDVQSDVHSTLGEVEYSDDGGTTYYPTSNMSSDTAPSPLVASTTLSLSSPYKVFNGPATDGNYADKSSSVTSDVIIDFGIGNGRSWDHYRVTCAEHVSIDLTVRQPTDWTVEGSMDGLDFVVLDTVSGLSGWSELEQRTYSI